MKNTRELFKKAIMNKAGELTADEIKRITGPKGVYNYQESEFRVKDPGTIRLRDHLTFGQQNNPDNTSKMKGRVKLIKNSRTTLTKIVEGDDFPDCASFFNDKPYEGIKYGEILPITKSVMEDQATDMTEVINDFYIERCIFTENYNAINGDGVNTGLLNTEGANIKIPVSQGYLEFTKLIQDNLKPQYESGAAIYVNANGLRYMESSKGEHLDRDKDGDLCFSKYKVFVLGSDELLDIDATNTGIIIGDLKRAGAIVSSNLHVDGIADFAHEVYLFRSTFMTTPKTVNTEAYFVLKVIKPA